MRRVQMRVYACVCDRTYVGVWVGPLIGVRIWFAVSMAVEEFQTCAASSPRTPFRVVQRLFTLLELTSNDDTRTHSPGNRQVSAKV